MYQTETLTDFQLPPLVGTLPWEPPEVYVAVLWSSPLAFRRAGIWTRLLGERTWFQLLFGSDPEDVEALVPTSQQPRTVLLHGSLGLEPDQVVTVLVVDGQVLLAMKDSPTEDAWEQFERAMSEAGI